MTTEPARLAGIPVLPGSRVEIFHIITLTERPGEWTKWETGQWVTHCSCALLPRLMWSGPYCELYCHAVCTWKLWNLPLPWFVYEKIRLNLIYPRILKKNAVCMWRCWTLSLPRFDREKNATSLGGHFAQWDFKKSPPFRKYAMKLCILLRGWIHSFHFHLFLSYDFKLFSQTVCNDFKGFCFHSLSMFTFPFTFSRVIIILYYKLSIILNFNVLQCS